MQINFHYDVSIGFVRKETEALLTSKHGIPVFLKSVVSMDRPVHKYIVHKHVLVLYVIVCTSHVHYTCARTLFSFWVVTHTLYVWVLGFCYFQRQTGIFCVGFICVWVIIFLGFDLVVQSVFDNTCNFNREHMKLKFILSQSLTPAL